MKLLVPLPFDLANLAHGRNLRIANLLQELAQRGTVTCLTPNQRLAESACRAMTDVMIVAADAAESARTEPAPDLPRYHYLLRKSLDFIGYDAHLLALTSRWASDYDAVLGFDLPSIAYLLAAEHTCSAGTQVICDLIDDPWLLRKSLARTKRCSPVGLKTGLAIRTLRRQALPRFDDLVAVAPVDAQSLQRATARPTHVIPNGVHIPDMNMDKLPLSEPLAIFTGAMDFPPNESAAIFLARKVWPLVLQRLPDDLRRHTRLALVGANPTPAVQSLADGENIEVTGYVKSMSDWFYKARLAVAPMVSGCGIKNKILEACAHACPVITTTLGTAGLDAERSDGIVVADDPGRMADEIVADLTNPPAARERGRAARRFVRNRFSWSRMAEMFMAICTTADTAPAPAPQPITTPDNPSGTPKTPATKMGAKK